LTSSNDANSIHWPERYRPGVAPVHVSNQLWIPAPPAQVWAWLVREPLWPTWYDNAHADWSARRAQRTDLELGSIFFWSTFGVAVESKVMECVPCERIAWNAEGFGVDAYHAWLLSPKDDGCQVLTEESQYGWGARLLNFLMPQRMSHGHAMWLKSLSIQSQTGLPPAL
jgi:hypothetical protein